VRIAIEVAHQPGLDVPNVAVLSAVETANPKITSTIKRVRSQQDGRSKGDHGGNVAGISQGLS